MRAVLCVVAVVAVSQSLSIASSQWIPFEPPIITVEQCRHVTGTPQRCQRANMYAMWYSARFRKLNLPQCDRFGNYEQQQSRGGQSWCVNPFSGVKVPTTYAVAEVPKTRTRAGPSPVQCGRKETVCYAPPKPGFFPTKPPPPCIRWCTFIRGHMCFTYPC